MPFLKEEISMIRHIVLARFPTALAPAEVDKVFAALHDLKDKIPGILSVMAGANNSPEPLARGYTHAFTVDFADAASRDAYLPHPDHLKVAGALVAATEGGVDGILVLDYEV
jgi:hypothetical protein